MHSGVSIFRLVRAISALVLTTFTLTSAAQTQADAYCDMPAGQTVVPGGARQWTARKAARWYAEQPFLAGCNYIPRNAVNQLEMWQEETFSPTSSIRNWDGPKNWDSTACAFSCRAPSGKPTPKGFSAASTGSWRSLTATG